VSATHKSHSVGEYLQQAAHNLAFATDIRKNKPEYLDWAATCLFYTAIHYINAYFAELKITIPRRHTSSGPTSLGRTNIVQQDARLKPIYPQYRHLNDESRDARYELKAVSETDYDKFLFPKLQEIKNFIIPKVK